MEKEKIHVFNRFYLLFSLLFSLAVPFISIPLYTEAPAETKLLQPAIEKLPVVAALPVEKADYLALVFWVIYGFVASLLAIRLINNIYKLYKKAASGTKITYGSAKLVLLEGKTLPHTFLGYIFLSKEDHENRCIEQELYIHELTHVSQKHTYDLLVLELLKVAYWFNPLLYLYKKAIQLNHEFLADEAVTSSDKDVVKYQQLLLCKSTPHLNLRLASSINYSITKKRFIMMTKTTTKAKSAIVKMASVQVIAGLAALFCIESIAKEKPALVPSVKQEQQSGKVTRDKYFKGVRIIAYKRGTTTKTKVIGENIILSKLYEELTDAEIERYKWLLYVPEPYVKKSPSLKEIEEFLNSKKYAIWIDGKNVNNNELLKLTPNEIAYFSGSIILKNARTEKHPQPYQYWFWTHKAFDDAKMGVQKQHYGSDTIEFFQTMRNDYSRP
ncbi:M56 family metallopeptidase [Flavobacterium cyanobacteriorum]|uniref:M56 family metallopeptidase n=1 Tax=Flavobacterium cyanobacteriorum TaxID=2022802 RepID=UPI001A9C6284|nr:M56 family metallopeptidase [Flavobacterium cyanobacteriorum]